MREFWREIGFLAGLMVIAAISAVGDVYEIPFLAGACIYLAYAWGQVHG